MSKYCVMIKTPAAINTCRLFSLANKYEFRTAIKVIGTPAVSISCVAKIASIKLGKRVVIIHGVKITDTMVSAAEARHASTSSFYYSCHCHLLAEVKDSWRLSLVPLI